MQKGEIISVLDHGSMWQLLYETEDNGIGYVCFDHRPFAQFYEGMTGQSFFQDYAFGRGREYVSDQLRGRRISVEGEEFSEVVIPED